MYIILWLLFGAFVGWLANIIVKPSYNMGIVFNIVVGLIGAALGMWLMQIVGLAVADAFTLAGLLVSVGGAILFIAIFSMLKRRL